MNIKPVSILAACLIFTAGCNQSPTTPTANNNASQPPQPTRQPVQAEPFHGQVYKSIDGRNVLTLTSKDECELMQNGTTLPCKYTKQTDALRVIATVMGTPQVIYYRFTDQGIQDNNGNVLLSPEKYDVAVVQLQQEQKRLELEREAQQKKELELSRHAEAIRASEQYYQVFYDMLLLSERVEDLEGKTDPNGLPFTKSPGTLTLADSYIEVWFTTTSYGSTYASSSYIFFHRIKKIGDLGEGTHGDTFFLDFAQPMYPDKNHQYPSHLILHFKSESDAQNVHKTLLEAYTAWKAKYPAAVLQ